MGTHKIANGRVCGIIEGIGECLGYQGPKNNVTMMLQYVDPAEGAADESGAGNSDAGPPGMRLVLFNLLQAEQKVEFLATVNANKPT